MTTASVLYRCSVDSVTILKGTRNCAESLKKIILKKNAIKVTMSGNLGDVRPASSLDGPEYSSVKHKKAHNTANGRRTRELKTESDAESEEEDIMEDEEGNRSKKDKERSQGAIGRSRMNDEIHKNRNSGPPSPRVCESHGSGSGPPRKDKDDKGNKVLKEVGYFALKTAAISGLVIGGTAIALPLIGFGALGPIGGSLAALYQSTFLGGTIASGSAFATLQSVGMVGLSAAAKTGIVAGSAAVSGATSALRLKKKKS